MTIGAFAVVAGVNGKRKPVLDAAANGVWPVAAGLELRRMKGLRHFACVLSLLAAGAARADTVSIASFRADISPSVGANICGYEPNQKSVEKHDPLYACGLLMDDGERRALMVSFDLVALDASTVRDLRAKCARELGIEDAYVLFTCTHNHTGPECVCLSYPPDALDREYLALFERRLLEAVRAVGKSPRKACRAYFNSVNVDENYNRRFVTGDNHASFTPHRRTLARICDGIADKELGNVFFYDAARTCQMAGGDGAAYVIGNYAAHPLAGDAPGIGGLRISADFPGFYRDYLKRETGADAMFVQGAAGDLVPKNDELGMEAARRTGENLAMASIGAMIDACRGDGRFLIAKPRLRASITRIDLPVRKRFDGPRSEPVTNGVVTLELQCLSLGDVAFVGVPGELTNELGLEIKWHSPYRRTWIAQLATGDIGYISGVNAFVQGGYEPRHQPFAACGGLKLVAAAADALDRLRRSAFPEDGSSDEPYPNNLDLPVVDIPYGVKATNHTAEKPQE